MAKFSSLLSLRMKQKDNQKPKVTALAERSKSGSLSTFSGLFQVNPLSDQENSILKDILINFQEYEDYDIAQDLKDLSSLTSEVKAITNQAVMLHGERIKKAQTILKSYKEGAFTSWLMATYGNRQTPYNFLQYFEFCSQMPKELITIVDEMPRQAVYALASRYNDNEQNDEIINKKIEIVKNYSGQSKKEMLEIIRTEFPLDRDDKRLPNLASQSISSLIRLKKLINHSLFDPSEKQKEKIYSLLDELFSQMKKYN